MAAAILFAVVPVLMFRMTRWFAVVFGGRMVMVTVSRRKGVLRGTLPVGLLLVTFSVIASIMLIEVFLLPEPISA